MCQYSNKSSPISKNLQLRGLQGRLTHQLVQAAYALTVCGNTAKKPCSQIISWNTGLVQADILFFVVWCKACVASGVNTRCKNSLCKYSGSNERRDTYPQASGGATSVAHQRAALAKQLRTGSCRQSVRKRRWLCCSLLLRSCSQSLQTTKCAAQMQMG